MRENFKKKILKNGMTVIFEKRNVPVVSVSFAVKKGGIHETINEKGISHFIEHMLFKGTNKRNAKQIAEDIEKKGGDMNGFTGENIAAYFCKMPSEYLDLALDVLSDMVKNPLFDETELEKERKVIFEEIKMIRDNPRSHVSEEIQRCLYTGTMEIPLIGTFDSVGSLDRKKLLDRFKKIYSPNNIILTVVGDADFNKIINFAEKNFGNEKGEVKVAKFETINASKIEERKGVDQANLMFAYHVPLADDKKNYAARVLNILMADGMSSRLFSEIREKRNLAYGVSGSSSISKEFAYNQVYVGTSKENVELVKKIILQEFEKVAKTLTEKELNEIKKQMTGNYKISMEDSQQQMLNLLSYESDGEAEDFYDFEKNILDVKLEDVKELAKNAKEKYSFFALVPE